MTPIVQRSARPRDKRKSLMDLQSRVLETELETYKKLDHVLDQATDFFRLATFHVVSGRGQQGRQVPAINGTRQSEAPPYALQMGMAAECRVQLYV